MIRINNNYNLKAFINNDPDSSNMLLEKAYICANADFEGKKIPEKFKVELSDEDSEELRHIKFSEFFVVLSSFFLDASNAADILSNISASASIVGLNLLAIKESLNMKDSSFSQGYEDYVRVLEEYELEGDPLFSNKEYEQLRDAILYLPLKKEDRTIAGKRSYKRNHISTSALDVATYLKDKMHLSRENQISFLYLATEIMENTPYKKGRRTFTDEQLNSITSKLLDKLEIIDNFKKSSRFFKNTRDAVISISNAHDILAVLLALEIYKKKDNYTKNHGENEKVKQYQGELYNPDRRILVEVGFLMTEIKNTVKLKKERRALTVVNPSCTFINMWLRDEELVDIPVNFVILNDGIRKLLCKHCAKDYKARTCLHVLSMCKYLTTIIPDDGEIIVSLNASELTYKETEAIKTRKEDRRDSLILAVDEDKSFLSSKSLVSVVDDSISSIIILPFGLKDDSKGKCNIWISDNEKKDDIVITYTTKKSSNEPSIIKLVERKVFEKSDFFPVRDGLRSHIRKLNASDNSYCINEPVVLTDNLRILYSGFSLIDEACNCKIKPTFRIQYKREEGDKTSFVPVENSTVSINFDSVEDAKSFLHNDYPFYVRKVKTKKKGFLDDDNVNENSEMMTTDSEEIIECSIGEIIRKQMDKDHFKYPDSIVDFVILFSSEIRVLMSKEDWTCLRSFVLNGKLKNRNLEDFTPDFLKATMFKNNDPDGSFACMFNIFRKVLDVAVKNNFLYRNEFEKVLRDKNRFDRIFGYLSENKAKTFSRKDFKAVYMRLIELMENGIPELEDTEESNRYRAICFCGLISLLTGLENNITPAIKIKDIEFTDYGFCALSVSRQLTNDGSEEKPIKDKYDYRIIPCGRILSSYIKKSYDRIKDIAKTNGLKEDEVAECYVCNCLYSDSFESLAKKIAPKYIASELNEILDSVLETEEVRAYIPTFDGGTKEGNLSLYFGNRIRENFKLHAHDIGEFTEDEIAYFLGNMGVTTAGDHYIDYKNLLVLLVLNTKLDRISSFLQEDESRKKVETGEGTYIMSEKPTILHLAIKTDTACDVVIKASHGVHVNTEG